MAVRSLIGPRQPATITARSLTPPVGPSSPLRQVYPVAPSFRPPVISLLRNTRDGRGVIVPVAVANIITSGTPITVAHNLGRLVQTAEVFSNNGGQLVNGSLQIGSGTKTTQTFFATEDLLNALVRFE